MITYAVGIRKRQSVINATLTRSNCVRFSVAVRSGHKSDVIERSYIHQITVTPTPSLTCLF